MRTGIVSVWLGLWLFGLTSCAGKPAAPADDVGPVDLVTALRSYAEADSQPSLVRAIRQLEWYADAHPDDYESRARLANAYTLLAVGYSDDTGARDAAFAAAIRHAEAAMLTVPGFAHVWRKRGIGFNLALQQLDHRHLEAMEYLKLALLLDYVERSGPMGKMLRYTQLQRAVTVMDRMEQIDRQSLWGNNLFSRGLYYLALPGMAGGDRNKAAALMAEAVAVNGSNTLPRWGRARYLAVATGDRTLFREDLKWVARQPLDDLVGHRPWNLLARQQAREMLRRPGHYFPR